MSRSVASREPSSAPQIDGYRPLRVIGSGGYADVYLYRQETPSQEVAIKVLNAHHASGDLPADLFLVEANMMARVSSHPYIAQIFHAGVADDGRPYLVMEYYPGENFQQRARREQMSVGEVLRVGVQLASAVETAHRASILHRDIKPGNVLTSAYGDPGLTDFGIASGHGGEEGMAGVSIPWASPEAITGSATDTRSDIYALAATVYTLLAGRSPFEIPGGDNSQLAMMGRIERDRVAPIGRDDIPDSLESILAMAMAKDPRHRPRTAADFGRQLQSVEIEMKLPETRLNLIGEVRSARSRADADDDATRIKGVTELDAQPTPAIRSVSNGARVRRERPARQRVGLPSHGEIEATVVRTGDEAVATVEEQGGNSRARKLYISAAAVVGMVLIALAIMVSGHGADSTQGGGADRDADQYEVNDGIDIPTAVSPLSVSSISATRNEDGSITYTWDAPDSGLAYAVTPEGSEKPERIVGTTYVSTAACIEVESIGADGTISAPTMGCVDE